MSHVVLVVVLVMFIMVVVSQDNATTAAPAAAGNPGPKPPPPSPAKEPTQNQPGALASLAKMFIDIPMGIAEALKDGAEVIESVIIAFMKGIFK